MSPVWFTIIGPLLKGVRDRFLTDVDAKRIASEARHKGIISKEHETSINEAKSKEKANEILFAHLCDQATQATLKKLCPIMTKDEAYAKMREFGQMLYEKVSIFVDWTQIAVELLNVYMYVDVWCVHVCSPGTIYMCKVYIL